MMELIQAKIDGVVRDCKVIGANYDGSKLLVSTVDTPKRQAYVDPPAADPPKKAATKKAKRAK